MAEVQDPDFLANAAAAQMELDAVETKASDPPETGRVATPTGDAWLNAESDTESPANNQAHSSGNPLDLTG